MGMSVRTEYYRYTQYVPPDSLFDSLSFVEVFMLGDQTEEMRNPSHKV